MAVTWLTRMLTMKTLYVNATGIVPQNPTAEISFKLKESLLIIFVNTIAKETVNHNENCVAILNCAIATKVWAYWTKISAMHTAPVYVNLDLKESFVHSVRTISILIRSLVNVNTANVPSVAAYPEAVRLMAVVHVSLDGPDPNAKQRLNFLKIAIRALR